MLICYVLELLNNYPFIHSLIDEHSLNTFCCVTEVLIIVTHMLKDDQYFHFYFYFYLKKKIGVWHLTRPASLPSPRPKSPCSQFPRVLLLMVFEKDYVRDFFKIFFFYRRDIDVYFIEGKFENQIQPLNGWRRGFFKFNSNLIMLH